MFQPFYFRPVPRFPGALPRVDRDPVPSSAVMGGAERDGVEMTGTLPHSDASGNVVNLSQTAAQTAAKASNAVKVGTLSLGRRFLSRHAT